MNEQSEEGTADDYDSMAESLPAEQMRAQQNGSQPSSGIQLLSSKQQHQSVKLRSEKSRESLTEQLIPNRPSLKEFDDKIVSGAKRRRVDLCEQRLADT